MQFVPGVDTPENLQFATDAMNEFQKVLDMEPGNVLALAGIASLYYNEKKFADAADWNRKVIAADPLQRPEDPGPIANPQTRNSLKAQWLPILDEGIRDLDRALQIDPIYADAMVYVNLLIRYRADLDDSTEQWRADTATADAWMRRSLEAKKGANAAPPQDGGVAGGVTGGVISGVPAPSSQPGTIRIGSNVSAANLTSKVEPLYPPLAKQARISGTVRLNVTIDKEGHVENLTLISGHPLLVQAAREAVQKWTYKPTLLNGNPVKVLTTVDVNFSLTQ